jgi:Transposase DDE domain group 1
MPARLPLLAKSGFLLDPRPLDEPASPHAGALVISRAFRSLKGPELCAANLQLKTRQRGYEEAQFLETILLLQAVGGDCPEDLSLVNQDPMLGRALGYDLPKVTAVRNFLERFHDEELALQRPAREEQKSFIMPVSTGLQRLQDVQAGLVGRVAQKYQVQGQPQSIATVDQDATIIESYKRSALPHYEGGRGYQPMVAIWAEADLVLADEWRDGNVGAMQEPLRCAQVAFVALPGSIKKRYFRGDSACHEQELLQWLRASERAQEPGGPIGFCVSARMSVDLQKAVLRVPEKEWRLLEQEPDGTQRQWAELDFVPGERGEKKQSQPLRYVGLRRLKPQGALFADGSDRHHHAVVTNLDWVGDRLLNWHREKAGSVEHVHDEIKNALAGGHVPSQLFGANAAWFKLTLMLYNIGSAIKGLCLEGEERLARWKKLRLLIIHLSGRLNRNACVLRLRFCASKEAIGRVQKVWEVFDLPTQASRITPFSSS